MGAMNDSCTWTDLKHRVGDQDGSVLERQSRCVMIAGRGRRARADIGSTRALQQGAVMDAELAVRCECGHLPGRLQRRSIEQAHSAKAQRRQRAAHAPQGARAKFHPSVGVASVI